MYNYEIMELTDSNFESKIIKNKGYFLVDFWASWCNPCKILSPILDDISLEYKNKIIVAKLNVEHNTKIPSKYSIKGIPTLLLFSDGLVKATKVGAVSKIQLKEFLDSNLS
ncbi:thioredoxin TrxA [Buchnera aphidicola (Neophyllaphis varicolor)]|uniref:thioredoxin TrxA n=1 Tax=Buchnera aphidicola TaxID=9 RepID=UPI0031B82870